MTDDQVFELAERNSFQDDSGCWIFKDEGLLDFVFMVKKAERERVAKWMMDKGYVTGHGDTIEDLLKELEWQAAERERAACAEIAEKMRNKMKEGYEKTNDLIFKFNCYALKACAISIRARGER